MQRAEEAADLGHAAGVALPLQLGMQLRGVQHAGSSALPQVAGVRVEQPRPRPAQRRRVGRLVPELADRLAVIAGAAGDLADRDAHPEQVADHVPSLPMQHVRLLGTRGASETIIPYCLGSFSRSFLGTLP